MRHQLNYRTIISIPFIYLGIFFACNYLFSSNLQASSLATHNLLALAGSSFALFLLYKNWQQATKEFSYQLILLLAAACYWLGDLFWLHYLYNYPAATIPDNNPSHVLYLATTFFMAIAVFTLLAYNSTKLEKIRLLFDTLLLGTFLAYLTFNYLILPLIPNFTWSNYFYLYLLFSAILDFFAAIALFIFYQLEHKYHSQATQITIYAFAIYLSTEFIYIYLEGHTIYYDYPVINLFWPTSLILLGLVKQLKLQPPVKLLSNPQKNLTRITPHTNLILFITLCLIILINPQNLLINSLFILIFIFRQLVNKHLQMHESLDTLNQQYQTVNNELLAKVQEIQEINSNLEYKILTRTKDLHIAANIDPLTNIPNRRNLNEYLQQLIQTADAQSFFALLIIDLDKFKYINDHYGHEIGDKILVASALKLSKSICPSDFLARYGGDEFIIILNDLSSVTATIQKSQKLLEGFQQPFCLGNTKILSTLSIGIALYPLHAQNSVDLIRFADIALYHSKNNGKNRLSLFNNLLLAKESRKLAIETNLNEAIVNCEFRLQYQPQVRLSDNKLMGLKAFVRWDSPELGPVEPREFIPIAEEIGLISQVNTFLFKKIAQDIKFLNENCGQNLTVCAHVSAKEFAKPDFAAQVKAHLKNYQLPPQWLTLEISEVQEPELQQIVLEKRKELSDLHINIALSDFGLGYTTLTYLEQYPINMLKISAELISQLPHSKHHLLIVRAIINLCQELKITTIAKGVETPAQFALLKELGCCQIQGCYASKPISVNEIVALLTINNLYQ